MFRFARVCKAAVNAPVPLSVRYDSLLVQCCIAAAVYFGPQDAVIAGLAALNGRAYSNSINRVSDVAEPSAELAKFYVKKGMSADAFTVSQGRRSLQVKFANVYK